MIKRVHLLVFLFTACADHSLTVGKMEAGSYAHSDLRLNGFYLSTQKVSPMWGEWTVVWLFKGSKMYKESGKCGWTYLDSIKFLASAATPNQDSKIGWGRYKIGSNGRIELNYWLPSVGGRLPAIEQTGSIISDTSFFLDRSVTNRGKIYEYQRDTFYFQPYNIELDLDKVWYDK